MSEYGCITNPPRTFAETAVLSHPDMAGVFSSGLVYESVAAAAAKSPGYSLYTTTGASASPVGNQPRPLGQRRRRRHNPRRWRAAAPLPASGPERRLGRGSVRAGPRCRVSRAGSSRTVL